MTRIQWIDLVLTVATLVLAVCWLTTPGWASSKITGLVTCALIFISLAFGFYSEEKKKKKK